MKIYAHNGTKWSYPSNLSGVELQSKLFLLKRMLAATFENALERVGTHWNMVEHFEMIADIGCVQLFTGVHN